MTVAAVLFDAYGTLIDTKNGSVLATEAILRKNNSSLDAAEVYTIWKRYHRQHIDALTSFIPESEVFLLVLKRIYRDYGINGNPEEDVKIMLSILGARQVFPETLHVVGKLRERYRIYIASTSDHEPLMSDLERNRLVVDRSFTSESVRAYKPKAEFYMRILEETGLRPEEAVFVGDSPVDDVLGPKSVGMKAAWINRNNRPFPEEIPAPDYQLVDLNGLLSIL